VVSLESVENVSVIISLKHTVSGKYLVSSRQPVQVWHVHVNALNSGSVLCRADASCCYTQDDKPTNSQRSAAYITDGSTCIL